MEYLKRIVSTGFIMCFAIGIALADITVPFHLVNGLVVVEAELNGELGNYVVDSGVNGVVINGEATDGQEFVTMDGTIGVSEVEIAELKLGNFVQKEVEGFLTDLSSVESFTSIKLAGILGCSVFTPHSILFDFENFEIRVIENESTIKNDMFAYRADFTIHDELPFCTIDMDGKSYNFILDSGATSHFIDSETVENLDSYILKSEKEVEVYTASNSTAISNEVSIKSFTLGNQSISNVKAISKDFSLLSKELGFEVHGLLSLKKLTSNQVLFDIQHNRLLFN